MTSAATSGLGRRLGLARRHAFGTLVSPTGADFGGRLEAIGLGRWASLFSRASRSEVAGTAWGWRP